MSNEGLRKKGKNLNLQKKNHKNERLKAQRQKNKKFLKEIVARAGVVEVLVKKGKNLKGWAWCDNFESTEQLINDLERKKGDYTDVFMSFNKPKEKAYADKELNRIYSPKDNPGKSFKDDDIGHIKWFFVDVDPVIKVRPVSKVVNAACIDLCVLCDN